LVFFWCNSDRLRIKSQRIGIKHSLSNTQPQINGSISFNGIPVFSTCRSLKHLLRHQEGGQEFLTRQAECCPRNVGVASAADQARVFGTGEGAQNFELILKEIMKKSHHCAFVRGI